MDKELWGVFFDDQGGQTYLVATFDDEEEANEYAQDQDERQFRSVMEEGEGEAPDWEDFEGMHYVEPVSPTLAADAHDELARGFAVRVE